MPGPDIAAGEVGTVHQLLSVWGALTPQRRMVAAGVGATVFVAVLLLARLATAPQMALLYAGLDPAAAGQVVAALDQRAVAYEVRGTAIHVDARQRDSLRLALAAEGLPANAGAGYEILDGLSGFGTTSQMFDAAYWRAKEGELARTILAVPQIRAARVHLAAPLSRPFERSAQPGASVTVTTSAGGLSSHQAEALRHLVAAAVAGLTPSNVAIIDSAGGLVPAADAAGSGLSDDRAAMFKRNLERLLEARVGRGNAVVEVNLAMVADRERLVERRFDPEGRVPVSTDTEERNSTGQDRGPAGVTVASNLPEGEGTAERSSATENSETRERVNYEVSEIRREVERGPGGVARVGVAVLINSDAFADGTAGGLRSATDDLADLEALVKSAIGFDAARGDQVTLRALPFSPVAETGTPAAPGMFQRLGLDAMRLVQLGVLALVALLLGLFVLRPLMLASRQAAPALAAPGGAAATGGAALAGTVAAGPTHIALPAPDVGTRLSEDAGTPPDAVGELRRLIDAREQDTAEILREWLTEPAEEPR